MFLGSVVATAFTGILGSTGAVSPASLCQHLQVADFLVEMLTKENENSTIEIVGEGELKIISFCAVLCQERLLTLLEMVTLKNDEPGECR